MTDENPTDPAPGPPPPGPQPDEARFAARLFHQWTQLREERQAQLAVPASSFVPGGPAEVPRGVELAAQWAWRFLVIAVAGYVLVRALGFLEVVVIPVVVALLVAALVVPLVSALVRIGLPRGLASLLVVLGGLTFVAALLTFAGQQVANGANDLADQTDDVFRVFGPVRVGRDAAPFVLRDLILVDDPTQGGSVPQAIVEHLGRDVGERQGVVHK